MQAEGLILAGGQSTRMGGRHKGSLTYRDETFTHHLVRELKRGVSCVRLSYGQEVKDEGIECPVVMDIYPGCGPIGGIYAGLRACESEWMLAAACDMPLMKIEMYCCLMDMLGRKGEEILAYDGAVPVTGSRIHPLAAIYRARKPVNKEASVLTEHMMGRQVEIQADAGSEYPVNRPDMADILEEQIQRGNYRIRDALNRLNILYVDVTGNKGFEQMLRNINTIEEYRQLEILAKACSLKQ